MPGTILLGLEGEALEHVRGVELGGPRWALDAVATAFEELEQIAPPLQEQTSRREPQLDHQTLRLVGSPCSALQFSIAAHRPIRVGRLLAKSDAEMQEPSRKPEFVTN